MGKRIGGLEINCIVTQSREKENRFFTVYLEYRTHFVLWFQVLGVKNRAAR